MEEKALLSDHTKENIYHCNKCGLCLASCPVYKEVLIESASPRGKVQLSRHILEGTLELSERMKEILSRCLLCGSCVAACPSGVHGDELFSGLRWRVNQLYGMDWKKKALFQILSRKWMTSTSTRLARWARGLFGRWVEGSIQMGNLPADRVPDFNAKPFSQEVPEVVRPEGEVKARVLYFHGCATNYLYGEIGHAVVAVLPRMGVEVRIPKDQGCCGIPIFLSGARETALDSIKRVLNDFAKEDCDAVIVDCATCGVALSKEYAHLLAELRELGEKVEDHMVQAAEFLATKTRDITAFIGEHLDWLPEMPAREDRINVTYHDPCHLLKGQGVGDLPRKVLQSLPNVNFVEMNEADACCGGGGSFQVEHPEISAAITASKVESINRTGAQVVATGCPGCRLTIAAHLDRDKHIHALHPVQLIQMGLEGQSLS
ncbi:MAG: (Fe-S)-binding protein [Desulfatiglandales bacterium]